MGKSSKNKDLLAITASGLYFFIIYQSKSNSLIVHGC